MRRCCYGMFLRRASANQDFLGGSGNFADLERVRDVHEQDTVYADIKVGANAHLGPVEVEYEHSERRLARLTDPATFESVTGSGYVVVDDGNPPDQGSYAIKARLADHEARCLDGRYLYAVRRPRASITGHLVCRIAAETLTRLDAYEGAGYRREPVTVKTAAGHVQAYVYLSASDPESDASV